MLQEALKEKVVVEEENLQDYERRIKEEKVKSWKEKALHGEFVQQTSDVAGEESWRWASKWIFKKGDRRLDTSCTGTSFKNKLYQAQHR